MRLLIITQKVNKDDPILGFFFRWITEFTKHFESLVVICLEKGNHDQNELPANVRVLSLGKEKIPTEKNFRFLNKIKFIFRSYKYIWQERKNYDAVFVHMNPIYIVFGGIFWRLINKKIFLWYTHRCVDLKLRIAEKFVSRVFTASKESFMLRSDKVIVTGHGIPLENFTNIIRTKELGSEPIRIVHIGRITPIKNLDVLVETAKLLEDKWNKIFLIDFIGEPIYDSDKVYKNYLNDLISKHNLNNVIHFLGNVSNDKIVTELANSDLLVNLTPTGGLDKVVLESMASGVSAFSSNKTFEDYFGEYKDRLIFEEKNANDLAQKIMTFFDSGDMSNVVKNLQKVVKERGDIVKVVNRISGDIVNT